MSSGPCLFRKGDPPASRARFFPSFFCFLAQGGMGVTVGSPSCCQRMRRACCAWSARSQISESGSLKLRQLAHTRSTSPNTSPTKTNKYPQPGHTCHSQAHNSYNSWPTPGPHTKHLTCNDRTKGLSSQVTHITLTQTTGPAVGPHQVLICRHHTLNMLQLDASVTPSM